MKTSIGRLLLGLLIACNALLLIGGLTFPPLVQRRSQQAFPPVEGEMDLDGLRKPVDIYRDGWGVPHIYAENHHDLFFAQGVVHAQDRFWQMDFWRHQGAGRLSELLGSSTLETDKFLRTLGWERVARQELENLEQEEREILEAYAQGVNAYLSARTGIELGLEYSFLPIMNRGYQPQPWTPLNSLTWAKAMAWDLRGNLDTEISRALLLKDLTMEELEQLYPPYPEASPVITHPEGARLSPTGPETALAEDLPWDVTSALLQRTMDTLQGAPHLSFGHGDGMGSNSWVVAGSLTDTGKPYLANDPHLGQQIPSIWYEVGLHCRTKSPDCQLDIAGFSFAGVPGIVIGHNHRVAWGFTNVNPDVMDLYIEKINPENPDQYLYQGEWRDMEIFTEQIQVAGGETVELEVRKTHHGPVIDSVYGLEEFADQAGVDVPEEYALALSWTALEPSCVFCAIWDFNLADNWEEFREAARAFAVPAQNLVYADVDGNIAYQMPGRIPIRNEGHDGMLPVPGWTGDYEWQGTIPFEELPYRVNPPQGYLFTANNAVVDESYPYLITSQWAYGFRAQRIQELIQDTPRPFTLETMKSFQADNKDILARDLLNCLLDLELQGQGVIEAQSLLSGWDAQADMDSAPAALYMATWQRLISIALEDDLPEGHSIGVDSSAKEIIRRLLHQPDHPWWDDQRTRQAETRDDILRRALHQAYRELLREQGPDPATWAWGKLHTITFTHQVMSSLPLVKTAFNRGPFPTAGGNAILNANGWNSGNPFKVTSVPSMRMIVDLDQLGNSITMHTTGQSGHPYHPHYRDMIDPWREVQYHPMLWERDSIEDQAEATLRLVP